MAFTVEQQYFIDQLRSMFSMRTQAAAGSSYKLDSRLGDEELWQDLRLGIDYFNMAPPIMTTYRYKDLYDACNQAIQDGQDPIAPENESATSIFTTAVLMCSAFFTGMRLQWFEAGKHFRYNDNGLSFERVKQADYQNVVAANIANFMMNVLPQLRFVMGMSRIHPKGLFSGTISFPRSLTRALRGTRMGT